MATRTISTKLAIDGEAEYRASVSRINSELKTLGSELKLVESNFKGQANSQAALTAKGAALQNSYAKQSAQVKELKAALENAQKAQQTYSARIEEAKAKIAANDAQMAKLKSSTTDTTAAQTKLSAETEKLKKELADATAGEAAAAKGVNDWQQKVNKAQVEVNNLDDELKKNDKYLDEAKRSTDGCAKSIDKFGKETEQAEKKTSKFSEIFKGAFWAGLATRAVSAVTQKIKEFARSAIEAGDRIGTMSEKIGLSTDRLQELEYAGTRLDVSVDTVTGSMTKLVRNMNTARAGSKLQIEAFNKLGIEIAKADGSLRDANTVFGEAIDALGKVHNETERDAIAMQLFGKSAQDLNPLIKAGSEELERLSEEAHEAGAVMSEETIEALDNFDETIEQAKLSAKAFVGEALAGIIGDGKTAAETIDDLQESLSETNNTQKLIDKYRRLSEELSSGALSAEEVKVKTDELEQAKQDLIKASGGVVTAFDIENGTFDQQVGVLENATQAEKDYLKHKLMAEIIENSGEGAKRKREKALKDYTDATKQHERALDDQAKAQEKVNAGILPEKALKAREANVEGWEETKLAALKALNATEEGAVEAESALQSLIDSGMTVSDVAEETGLSVDELNDILSSTGDASTSAIPEVQALGESIDELNAEYEAAKETVAATLDSVISGWDAVPPAVAISAEQVIANLQSQLDWMTSYRENLDALMSREIPGVDTSALITSLSDGSTESAAILAGLKTATDDQVAQIAQSMGGISAGKQTFIDEVGAAQINYDERMAEMVDTTVKSVKEMDLGDDAKVSALNTINGYINGVRGSSGPGSSLNLAMTRAAQSALNAWKAVFREKSPSRAMMESGENAIKGNIKGVENQKDYINKAYAEIAQQAMSSFSIALPSMTAINQITQNTMQTINHTGTIRVEGINNQGEFISATEIVLEDLRRGARL